MIKVPYIDPSVIMGPDAFKFKEGDIVLSVPVKAGTHWTMFLTYSILSGGAFDFQDMYDRVPWLEFRFSPTDTQQDRVRLLENTKFNTPGHRTFKSHLPPMLLGPDKHPEVKYVFVYRNPYDMVLSMAPFFRSHTDEFFAAWGLTDLKQKMGTNEQVLTAVEAGAFPPFLFEGFKVAWALRKLPNVLLLHFTDLKNNLPREVDRLVKFLGKELTAEQRALICERGTFQWMKQHEDQFSAKVIGFRKPDGTLIPALQPASVLRKGEVGENVTALTDEQRGRILNRVKQVIDDPELLSYIFDGTK
jgi:hypothetical protein